jgi:hypothetical protein
MNRGGERGQKELVNFAKLRRYDCRCVVGYVFLPTLAFAFTLWWVWTNINIKRLFHEWFWLRIQLLTQGRITFPERFLLFLGIKGIVSV